MAIINSDFQEGLHMPDQDSKSIKVHMPKDSYFFEKIVPALLIVLGIIMAILILFAAGVLLGIIHF